MDLYSKLSVKSFRAYFRTEPWVFLLNFLLDGRYPVYTYDKDEAPKTLLVSTIFYVDGDVQHELNEMDGDLLAVNHPDRISIHFEKVKTKIQSIKIVFRQIEILITSIIGLITFLITSDWSTLQESILYTFGISSIAVFARKQLANGLLWLVQKIASLYMKQFLRRLVKL